MCRFAAYVGPSAPISTLIWDAPHGLLDQASRPLQQRFGRINVDGTGVAWWPEGEAEPLRYVTDRPPWSDSNLAFLAPRLHGRLQIAAVRSASPGIPFGAQNVHPFVHEGIAGTHNGFIRGYRGPVGRALLDQLPDDLHAAMGAVSDALALFMTALRHLRDDAEGDLAAAAAAAVLEVQALCAAAGEQTTLNLLLSDGERIVATRASHGAPPNTLYTLRGGARWPGATLLASEPLDDDEGWEPVPDGHAVVLTEHELTVVALEDLAPGPEPTATSAPASRV